MLALTHIEQEQIQQQQKAKKKRKMHKREEKVIFEHFWIDLY